MTQYSPRWYILDANRLALPCADLDAFIAQGGEIALRVAETIEDEYHVSTVFLGLDHNHLREGDPLLFETMVFLPGGETGAMERYSTWAQAEAGHERISSMLAYEAKARKRVNVVDAIKDGAGT